MRTTLSVLLALFFSVFSSKGEGNSSLVWSIGKKDNSSSELALGPSGYKKFLANDFGFEDRYYLIGKSTEKKDFPYVLPGPNDTWGGTWGTSGWRTHEINILWGVKTLPADGEWKLIIDLVDTHPKKSLLKVSINSQNEKFLLKDGGSDSSLVRTDPNSKARTLEIPINKGMIQKGGNVIRLTILEGSWVVFDDVRLSGPSGVELIQPEKVYVREIKPASYEIDRNAVRCQPLLVDVEHLSGQPKLQVKLDNQIIYNKVLDSARYVLEVPMPAVQKAKTSKYNVSVDGKTLTEGSITRTPQKLQTPADYVNTEIGTAHSRWMIAPGPWMPFSMVKLSPDNQNEGWQAGYQPTFETVGCFSHIHEWTMGGLGMLPVNGPLQTKVGDEFDPDSGYRSRIDKATEQAPLGYYRVHLTDYDIWAELTATTRCSFQRYTFPKDKSTGRVMIDLKIQAEYRYQLEDIEIRKVSDYRIEGVSHQKTPNVWSHDADQEYRLNFVIEFDQPIQSVGGWIDDQILKQDQIEGKKAKFAGMYVEFDTQKSPVVQVRSGISMVSVENASENLKKEITTPFGWSFDAVRKNQMNVWNDLFSRVKITTDDRIEKIRFYNNMYRAICSRNTWSDVNGEWTASDGSKQKFTDPDHVALGCDAFWNTFWNLNQFWNLVTPEWSNRWVNSQLAMYRVNGWLAKGPAGMKYVPVMVAEHEIPLIISAYQMGIRGYNPQTALEAAVKMQTTPAQHIAGGFAGNRDLVPYLKHHYVPYDKGRFSNTLEYSFDDWTVSQLAKSLGKEDVYKTFADRGNWWKNAFNLKNGYAQLRDSAGNFKEPFDPFHSGANEEYVEGNSWQLSYFVPQDVPALAQYIGKQMFTDRLEWGFQASEPWRYNAPNDQYWDYPVVQGNQQSMHFSFLFNWVGKPWLTQTWTRSIAERYYGAGIANAYLGDEDQGQMSAWFIMAAIGLFQTDGGCRVNPIYEIASPMYEKTVINLGKRFGRGNTFTIEAKNASRINKYVQSAILNGKPWNSFQFPASELLKGGSLVLVMGPQPNTSWGIK